MQAEQCVVVDSEQLVLAYAGPDRGLELRHHRIADRAVDDHQIDLFGGLDLARIDGRWARVGDADALVL